jgi:2-polyprenyl-3-methyl-5-hydroxy-6-metoxy-1,4-benzoquinol methylase
MNLFGNPLSTRKFDHMNPYRKAFYERQYEWHGYQGTEDVENKHILRSKYYRWYTHGWLPESRSTPVLDIGCGSGQFLYFLRGLGYNDAVGIDVDRAQVETGRALGLDTRCVDIMEFLKGDDKQYGLIAMLDILEHFTREELFPLLSAVAEKLVPGGRLIASVPNAESPLANEAIYADITHEIAFTPTSLGEMFFCHGLKVSAIRDPWPAPISPLHRGYRSLSVLMRKLEALRLKALGFSAPKYWSSVIWAVAEKPIERAPG